MTEVRYIKIETCKNCPNFGHTRTRDNLTTFICGYPKNMEIEQLPAEKIGDKMYPITHVGGWSGIVPIPFWCKLPSRVVVNNFDSESVCYKCEYDNLTNKQHPCNICANFDKFKEKEE